jgi:AraC-like DNA-binding protein
MHGYDGEAAPSRLAGEELVTPPPSRSRASDEFGQRLSRLTPLGAYKVVDLARRLGLSERQLRRTLRASVGVSPREWLRRQRLAAALQMLTTAQSVKQVALSLGYTQMSQFSRDFKAQFGCAPSMVLKKARQDKVTL